MALLLIFSHAAAFAQPDIQRESDADWVTAREAALDGKLGDAESAVARGLPAGLEASRREAVLADRLKLLALSLLEEGAFDQARELGRTARRRQAPPTGPVAEAKAAEVAMQWHLEGVVQWRVFGDLEEARAALARALELDAGSQREAKLLIDHIDAIEREAAIKGEAVRREQGRRS